MVGAPFNPRKEVVDDLIPQPDNPEPAGAALDGQRGDRPRIPLLILRSHMDRAPKENGSPRMDAQAKRLYSDQIQTLLLGAQLYTSGDLLPERFASLASTVCSTLTALERNGHGELEQWIARASEPAASIVANLGEKPPSIVGDGLLVHGTVAVFYGQPGLGKTWLLLQLAHAIAAGRPWLDIPIPSPCTVGFISLELPRYYIGDRFIALSSSDPAALSRIHIVCRPTLKGQIDLLHPLTLPALLAWIRDLEIQVVVLDPLSRAHSVNENAAQEMGQVLSIAEQLAASGPLVILNHHEGHPNPELGSQHPRGSSRLLSDPNTVLNLTSDRGTVCLMIKKLNLGIPIDPIYLKQTPEGTFERIDRPPTPTEAKDLVRDDLDEIIKTNPGLTASQLSELLPFNPKTGKPYDKATMSRHLKALRLEGRVHSEPGGMSRNGKVSDLWFTGMEHRDE